MTVQKKFLSILAAGALLAASLTACNSASSSSTAADASSAANAAASSAAAASTAQEAATLNISAAASLTESMDAIKALYEEANPTVTLTMNYASSGNLQKQIEEGAPSDVFISAAQKQMDALEKGGHILTETRKDLLVNKVVLITPQNSDKGIASFDDCNSDKAGSIALGDPESVPVGQYAQQVFEKLGTWDAVKAKASLAADVKEVLSWVETGNTDCGVVYATDAATASDKVKVVCEAPEDSYDKAVYPAALVKGTENEEAAKAFLTYLSGEEAKAIFEKNGFTIA